jgi:two-component system CheB/CheR fusion protein
MSTRPANKATAPSDASVEQAPDSPAETVDFPVVGIGASAGGLDACRALLDALPPHPGMAFILVQHLDPTHGSMMAALLATHTSMTVCQAVDGTLVAPDHFYVIPPGYYLGVRYGKLQLSPPQARHGARLPFDFLLRSLADAYGHRALCVVLSGTGSDGSLGVLAIKAKGGLVIAQNPDQAGYGGMPRSAIATGAVDHVLDAAHIPDALRAHLAGAGSAVPALVAAPDESAGGYLPAIIDIVRTKAAHNFTLYKPGTLQRRIERRMSMAGLELGQFPRYVELLRNDQAELDALAKDLLINVTGFFRDPKVFALLEETTIPAIVREHSADRPIRVWIVGCSTGEEAYSLAILFREALAAAHANIKLQVFASDVDSDAVAVAREGLYPESIAADISPARLAQFFNKEENKYRVSPELRAAVVFTEQDVLADAPFSRLDFIACRNLLIYLQPEAQAKIISLFHFALREGGILLLGNAESIGTPDDRFEVVAKAERIYRHIGRSRPGELAFLINNGDGLRLPGATAPLPATSREATLAEIYRRALAQNFTPAAVLINKRNEILYAVGATERYLRVASGPPTQDLLALARPELRVKLRSAIHQAIRGNARTTVPGGRTRDGPTAERPFIIDVLPAPGHNEDLLLVCFVDMPAQERSEAGPVMAADQRRVAQLQRELDATRAELQGAIDHLEVANEEQKALNEEALSRQEEYQSTNEELLTSKEELQSLNEELTALNGQLQETLDRERTTSNDLQNVLYSTDVATVFLDRDLNIRFFTPATKSLFNLIPGDIGRPLADLSFLATDHALLADARTVLRTLTPLDRETDAGGGIWYMRRILPYRTQGSGVEGVVITFTDITARRADAEALRSAMRQAEMANIAKSRFLAAASHDLRQPLQTLALLQGLLATTVEGKQAQELVGRLDETLDAMSGMLNTLLDINQIEAGTIRPNMTDFPIHDLLTNMRDQFAYHAQAQGLALRVVPCSLAIRTDPRLLEQMVRNLISNALKYTPHGKVLLGCRRRGDHVRIEVWDTGVGIPPDELQAIFEEYHQVENPARERGRGLGLGLSIVQRLGNLLGHRVHVLSNPGRGSVFGIEVPRSPPSFSLPSTALPSATQLEPVNRHQARPAVLAVEDDQELRELLAVVLRQAGYDVTTAPNGLAALDLVAHQNLRPRIILADYNLPGEMDGLHLAAHIRDRLGHEIPAIILTGDISAGTLRDVERQNCARLNKPVRIGDLTHLIERLLTRAESFGRPPPAASAPLRQESTIPTVYVVDDDRQLRITMRDVLVANSWRVEEFATCEAFLAADRSASPACLLIDAYLPGMSGMELLRRLLTTGDQLPAIMITGNSDVAVAVQAMKSGASDFIEKPVGRGDLIASIERALEHAKDFGRLFAEHQAAAKQIAGLSARQREVMKLVLAGHPSKNIAADLGISQRTVENHRAQIMRRTGAKSLPALARVALAAASANGDETP